MFGIKSVFSKQLRRKLFPKQDLAAWALSSSPMLCEIAKEGPALCSFPSLMGGKVWVAFFVSLVFHSLENVNNSCAVLQKISF